MNALIVPALFGLVVKATALLLAAGLACGLCRRASAALRHLVWSAALAGLLLLPVLSASLPRWNIVTWGPQPAAPPPVLTSPAPVPVAVVPRLPAVPRNAPAPTPPLDSADTKTFPIPPAITPTSAPRIVSWGPFPWATVLISCWAIGALALAVRLAVGLGRAGRLGRRAVPLTPSETALAEAARRQLGLRRRVTFLRATDDNTVPVPVTWGLWWPVVLLPPASASWSADCLRTALLHELAHATRGDWATQLLGGLACALYWWHPLVWGASRRAREEGERACDDRVLGTGMPPADYAQRLVDVVRSLPPGARPNSAAVAMAARPSEVAGRVQAILARGHDRRLSRRVLASALTLSAALLLPLAALRLVTRTAATVPTPPGDQVTLPNGYSVGVAGLTRAVPLGNGEVTYGGPFWGPDGTPLPNPLKIQGQWRTPHNAHNVFALDLTLTPRASATTAPGASTFYEVHSAEGRPAFLNGHSVMRMDDWSKGIVLPISVPASVQTCTVRYGVAAGPWRTVATMAVHPTPKTGWVYVELGDRPTVAYQTQDRTGRIERTDEFLGASGRIAGNLARRAVLVDAAGLQTPLPSGIDGRGLPDAALNYRRGSFFVGNSKIALPPLREILLQTCPYQFAEFRHLPLHPLAALRPAARAQHGTLAFVYLKDVSSNGQHGRPVLRSTRGADGRWSSVLINETTGQQARDPRQVLADLTGLLSEGWQPRPDAQPYRVPDALAADMPARRVFFTPAQQQLATKLAREKAAWDRMLRDAPVIATGADVEPQTTAAVRPQPPLLGATSEPASVINIRLSSEGARKMTAFTAAHHGEILGILLDGDLLTAPMIADTVHGTDEVIEPQATLAEAQQIAQRINQAATAPVTPLPSPRPAQLPLPEYVRQLGPQRFREMAQLRAHLQPWAITHAALLDQMAHAQPGDLAPAMRVYRSLQMAMLISSQANWAGNSGGWAFEMPLGLTLSHLQRSPEPIDRIIRANIAQYHDIMVAHTMVPGTLNLAVWASGRVTLVTQTDQFVGHHKPLRMVESQRELLPPFLPPGFAAQPVYGYRRYVSPPLPDGTRYTFLYPSCDTQVQQQRPGPKDPTWFTSVGNRSPTLGWAAARGQTPIPPAVWENAALFRAPYEESCSIVVGRAGEVRFPAGVHALRRDTAWSGKGESYHALSVTDQRTGMRFLLSHENQSLPALFRQTDPVIMGSFRILPPRR